MKGYRLLLLSFCLAAVMPQPGCSNSNSNSNGAIDSFHGNIVLGSPTATSIKIKVFSPDQGGSIYIAYGPAPNASDQQTAASVLQAAQTQELILEGLAADAQYYYRLYFQATGESRFGPTSEYAFHTARSSGSTFTFTVQADPHLDENSSLDLYRQTLANELADTPDFMIDLGDTFMCEKHSAPLTATVKMAPDYPTVVARYIYERSNFGIVAHSAPLFLVNGNHEGESGWFLNGTADNIAVWATLARQAYFPTPLPNGFYSGGATEEPFVGKRGSWYAWNWGDALFIVLDPFWYTTTKPGRDGWALTLGPEQYRWLAETLKQSGATFRFVFIHNLVGGLDGQMRGGIEAAPFYEWGGQNADGTPGFDVQRPGWGKPIHQLLEENHVTAVFHGHDHVYVKQEFDGITYQEVPQPSAPKFNSGPSLAAEYHYQSGTIASSSGHLRVTVGPDKTKVDYVRAYRPQDENSQRHNGDISDAYSLMPR